MQNDVYYAAQQTEDILDKESGVARSFDSMIDQADSERHQEMLDRMHKQTVAAQPQQQSQTTVPPIQDPYATLTPTSSTPDPQVTYNPYPNDIHQSVVSPLSSTPATLPPQITPPNPQPATSEKPVSPDIINLANNSDLSIETIAHEANRIHQKEEEGEVVISLR
jgi:hypothetical protein